ncbi:uncharacterized protein LOC119404728 [Rhipicephalus sanguineus]|uniref:uncharacterized protein LOC119404728 n=1 Tax=Rhipicephalus sanguineus TaxID=34632 RepID=UPI0020C3B7CC|nr:uncharacterized protein LOC119404728 [Rhipicephalus sanguineus]
MPQLPKGKPEVKCESDPKRGSKRESKTKGLKSSASSGGNSVNIGNRGSSSIAKPEASSSSKPLDAGAAAEVKKKPEVVTASTSFAAEPLPPPAAEPEVLFPTCSTGAVPKRIVVQATSSSSSSSAKRGTAHGDSHSGTAPFTNSRKGPSAAIVVKNLRIHKPSPQIKLGRDKSD